MRSITEGVYTVQQAARGQQLYKAQCAECHGNVMEGTTGPPPAATSASAQTLSHLVDKIQKTIRSTYLEACPDSNPLSWRRIFSRRAGSRPDKRNWTRPHSRGSHFPRLDPPRRRSRVAASFFPRRKEILRS